MTKKLTGKKLGLTRLVFKLEAFEAQKWVWTIIKYRCHGNNWWQNNCRFWTTTNLAIESYTNIVMMLDWCFVISFQSLHSLKTWKLVPSTLDSQIPVGCPPCGSRGRGRGRGRGKGRGMMFPIDGRITARILMSWNGQMFSKYCSLCSRLRLFQFMRKILDELNYFNQRMRQFLFVTAVHA